MSLTLDAELAASLAAGMPGQPQQAPDGSTLPAGTFGGEWERELRVRRRANDAVRDVHQAGQITLVSGAGTLQDFNRFGVPQGYWWAIYRLTAQGFSAGTVTAYEDSVNGEPLMPFTVPAVNILSKSSTILHSMSQVVWQASGITGSVNVWLRAVQFEAWLWPWFIGANR